MHATFDAPWEGRARGGHRGPRRGGPWGRPGFGPFGGVFAGPFGGFDPWGRAKARRGDVRAAILALLAERPHNGYQVIQEIEERSGGEWRPSPGAVYPALQQLADEGLIEPESEGRKTFRLTEAGRAHVAEHPGEVSAPWEAMTSAVRDDVRDLFTAAAQTGAAVAQVARTGTESQIAEAGDVLAEARRRIYTLLADDE